jgi:hypothetical protein
MPTLIAFLSFVFTVIPSQGLYSVTSDPQSVTFYTLAYQVYGTMGMLAHEDLAGAAFTELQAGDIITLTYPAFDKRTGLNKVRRLVVTDVLRYRASAPLSEWSGFVDMKTGIGIGSEDLGRVVYNSGHALVLQTCFNQSQGRLFIIANAISKREDRIR